jgi:hypothetical protein
MLSRIPHLLDNWLSDGDNVVSITRRLSFTLGRFFVTISVRS